MDENLEATSPAGGPGTSPTPEAGSEREGYANTAALEKALDMANAGEAGNMPRKADVGNSAVAENRRGAAMMPQGSILKIPVNVQVILGTTRMPLSKVMALEPGSVVTLDKELSEPVVLLVNGNEVARGLIVVVNEKTGQLGISLTEISLGNAAENSSKPV